MFVVIVPHLSSIVTLLKLGELNLERIWSMLWLPQQPFLMAQVEDCDCRWEISINEEKWTFKEISCFPIDFLRKTQNRCMQMCLQTEDQFVPGLYTILPGAGSARNWVTTERCTHFAFVKGTAAYLVWDQTYSC